ncbi:MAG: hypothetical protein ACJAUG_000621 [Halioglobus sp.]|jgi:hypothetical protein
MFDFLEWYFPWSQIDLPLKMMALAWLASTAVGFSIFVYAVLLKKPWLSMRHMRTDK